MSKRDIQNFFNDKKESLTIDYLYSRNKNKGISKSFIRFLVSHNQKEAIKMLNTAKSYDDFRRLVRENFDKLERRSSLYLCYAMGGSLGLYDGSLDYVPHELSKRYLDNDINKEDLKIIMDLYKEALVEYINSHNDIKHELVSFYKQSGVMVADFNEEFGDKEFNNISSLLFNEVSGYDVYRKQAMSGIIFNLGALYNKDVLLNNASFVKFEIQYGYFDKYVQMLSYKEKIPSLEERINIFKQQSSISAEQQYHLDKIDLLEKRVRTLKDSSKDLILEKIALVRSEKDIIKKAMLVDECFRSYEEAFRKELVDSVFTPGQSMEVGDFKTAEPVLLHLFIRDPMKRLNPYREQVRNEIISARGVKVTGEEDLTPEEIEEYQSKIDYAINVLLNPVVTSKSLEEVSMYSDSTGTRWYKSNTSNQISISLFSPEVLMNLSNCIGVGFDKTGIDSRNIIISSNYYQTTNMGVDNLEVSPDKRFDAFSAPLEELSNSKMTEIVMYREHDGIKTDASYVFAIVSGYNEKKDRETILEAKEYAEKNNIKMVVFNLKKLRQSYEDMFKEDSVAMDLETAKVK